MTQGSSHDSNKTGTSWSLTVLAIGLFCATAYRTAHYIWMTLPPEWWFISIAGILAFDAGVVIWSQVLKNNAANREQEAISQALLVIDILGMTATNLADSVDKSILPTQITEGVMFAVPTIIVLNVLAAILFSMVSEEVKLSRERRKSNAEIQADKQKMLFDKERLEQQETLLVQEEKNAELQMRLEAMRRGLQKASNQGDHVTQAAENIAARVRSHFSNHPTMASHDGDGNNGTGTGTKPKSYGFAVEPPPTQPENNHPNS